MHYKAVLLDFYGTLVEEDEPILLDITRQVAAASPLAPTPAQVSRRWWELMGAQCQAAHGNTFCAQREIEQASLREVLQEFKAELDPLALSQDIFAYWQSPRAYPDAADFLRRAGLPVCVVSNIDEADVRAAVAAQGWDLPRVVTSETCRAYKLRPEMFRAALDLLGMKALDVLHVGDSATSDVAGARMMGIDVAWVNRRGRLTPSTPPTYVVTDLSQLLPLL